MFIFFDLDGVLIDLRELHRDAFITAWNSLSPNSTIDTVFHSKFLEARPTKDKIPICNRELNTSASIVDVSTLKQTITEQLLADFSGLTSVTDTIRWLKAQGHVLACCSNSIRNTINIALTKLHILEQFDLILSNEDVAQSKPNPEIYLKAAAYFGVHPSTCLVFEDSVVGKLSAKDAGCHVIPVTNASDLTLEFVSLCIAGLSRIPAYVHDPDFCINLVIPMAGLGSRFEKEGYKTPKPFLPIHGKCMYKWIIENMLPQNPLLRSKVRTHIVIRQEHLALFESTAPGNIQLHIVPVLTEGPACTVLSIKDIVNTGNPLVIANSDQHLEWDSDALYYSLIHPNIDGVISTFMQPDPFDIKWSYAKTDANKKVTEVAEKRYISSNASTGIYGWKQGSEFVRYAESMIKQNIRVNNEFYVCPVYNEAIRDAKCIRVLECERMWGLGIPQDYEYFLAKWCIEEPKKKAAIFIHAALLKGYNERINIFLSLIQSSGLYKKIDTIFISCIGNDSVIHIDINAELKDKVKIIRANAQLTEFEVPTQKLLYDFCKENPNYNVLYLHTKGVGKEKNMCIEDWIQYMIYFLIEKHETALSKLEEYTSVGVDLLQEPTLHYSGNFWWAKASYINTLPDPLDFKNLKKYPNPLSSERHNQEFWICYIKQNHYSLWQSNINCYERHLHRYGRERYAQ